MTTLIIPCSGKSSRFPNIKPKWLYTHPNGKLMIERAIENLLPNKKIKKKIITITKEIDQKYNAKFILNQVFKGKVNVLVLNKSTDSASQTVFNTIINLKIKGQILVKDCDSFFKIDKQFKIQKKNFVLYCDVKKNSEIQNIHQKSFLITNDKNQLINIEEKKIISDKICVGLYSFKSTNDFIKHYKNCHINISLKETYVSYIVKSMIADNHLFLASEAIDYEDYGTFADWLRIRRDYRTFFVDIDGVIFLNKGKYGKKNWDTKDEVIKDNVNILTKLNSKTTEIIFTSSRPDIYKQKLTSELRKIGFSNFKLILGLNHGQRILINDFAISNPNPSAASLNIARNSSQLKNMIESLY
tara:strand:- start:209 stop:1279 length:1071 start_codon:yes stop_codon:yes gene_type:complete